LAFRTLTMDPLIQQQGAAIVRSWQNDPKLHWRQVQLTPRVKKNATIIRYAGSLTPYPFVPGVPGSAFDAVPEISQRFKAPSLLFLGSIFGLSAFVFVLTIRMITFVTDIGNDVLYLGHKFESTHGYWPGTVSEGVSDANSPQGKIFFGGCLASVLTFFISYYPFNLRNVYTGPETLGCSCAPIYWATFRQYFPTLGLLIVICVSTYPAPIAAESPGNTMQFCVVLHLLGAAMMFPGYMACEMKCLHLKPFHQTNEGYTSIEGKERAIRLILITFMLIFFTLFCLFQGVMMLPIPEDGAFCCYDTYIDKGEDYTKPDGEVVQFEKPQILNTAYGWPLFFKMASYLSECVAGVALLLSHITIWYYCEERKADYCQPFLEMVVDEELEKHLNPMEDDEDEYEDD